MSELCGETFAERSGFFGFWIEGNLLFFFRCHLLIFMLQFASEEEEVTRVIFHE